MNALVGIVLVTLFAIAGTAAAANDIVFVPSFSSTQAPYIGGSPFFPAEEQAMEWYRWVAPQAVRFFMETSPFRECKADAGIRIVTENCPCTDAWNVLNEEPFQACVTACATAATGRTFPPEGAGRVVVFTDRGSSGTSYDYPIVTCSVGYVPSPVNAYAGKGGIPLDEQLNQGMITCPTHELGHSLGGLCDEYGLAFWSWEDGIQGAKVPTVNGPCPNQFPPTEAILGPAHACNAVGVPECATGPCCGRDLDGKPETREVDIMGGFLTNEAGTAYIASSPAFAEGNYKIFGSFIREFGYCQDVQYGCGLGNCAGCSNQGRCEALEKIDAILEASEKKATSLREKADVLGNQEAANLSGAAEAESAAARDRIGGTNPDAWTPEDTALLQAAAATVKVAWQSLAILFG
ncbi:MAG: hypothetical protein HY369_04535 [Candidatus Aenigmarchaeota archaeon]|nr:hypothetical protein [Candidatus Aenigmarchaeota archaeon]